MTPERGVIISLHELGATARLADGTLVSIPASEVAHNRAAFAHSLRTREPIALALRRDGRHVVGFIPRPQEREGAVTPIASAPRLVDPAFEDRLSAYLKSTEEWAPADRPPPAERHFIRKKRRAAYFEARSKPT